MAREIKFRGKSVRNGKWLYAVLHGFGMDLFDETVYNDSIGQYTGLKDCNGNDIYEGDIIRSEKYNDIKHTVLYDEQSASFCAICIDGY